ncbi:MAG: hypothetical protein M3081_10760 [Gemmatimonadota bacterium]|nr:hypothetical protein [Gemmatimonadota bacterium]
MHKHAIYPDGHPLLGAAAVALARRLSPLLDQRASIAFGVAPNQLVIEGVPTDTNNPVLRDLAFRLYKRGVGALKLMRGLEIEELGEVLKVVARDPPTSREDKIKHLGPEHFSQWKNARVYALLYDQLELMDGESGDIAYEGESGTWAAQLWLALARHAMTEGDDTTVGGGGVDEFGLPVPVLPTKSVDPLIIARAIERRQKDATYDEAIVGYLSRFAEEIRARGGVEAIGLQRRISQLVGALSPETLKRLMFLSGDQEQRTQFLLDSSHILEVETVVELVKSAADASNRSVSNPLLILLSKLAKHAEVGAVSERSKADWALRENVRQLIGGWQADEVLPDDDYERVLEQLVRQTPGLESTPSAYACEADRTIGIALEIGVIGSAAKRAVTQLIAKGKLAVLLDLMDTTEDLNGSIDALWKRLGTPGLIRQILRIQPVDFQALFRVLSRVGRVGIEPVLDALQDAEDRTTRWKLFEMLVQLGPDIGPIVVERLPEAPWFVQRNLLGLLGRLSEWPADWSPIPYANHEDVRVRREAVKLLLKMPAARDQAIVDGLVDADESIVRLSLGAAMEGCPEGAVPLLIKMLNDRQTESVLRVQAVRVLATVHSTVAMDCLVKISLARRRWLVGKRRLKSKSAELLAALQGLTSWQGETKASQVLVLAAAHPDAEVRDAATPGVGADA